MHIPAEEVNPYTGDVYCGTMPAYAYRQALKAAGEAADSITGTSPTANVCAHTTCEDPAVRDKTNTTTLKMRTVWNVFNKQVTQTQLDAVISEFQRRMKTVNVEVVVSQVHFVTDTKSGTCLPPYDDPNDPDAWYTDLMDLKLRHAKLVGQAMNIFIGCQTKGASGTLLGIATFPWDDIALTEFGGLWLNSVTMFPDDSTLIHESGHCFGLRHTFAGVDENSGCSSTSFTCGLCCELPHLRQESSTDKSNLVGDFCSDTSATRRRWECATDPGLACDDVSYSAYNGGTDYWNPMSYAMVNPITGKEESCQKDFTTQQMRRIHCYLRGLLKGWIDTN